MNEKKQLHESLVNFRKEISAVKKGSNNPFFKSKYADLNAILEVIKDPLTNNKLCLVHSMNHTELGYVVRSTITHSESSEAIYSEFPVFGSKPQEVGSSMTYARRYNIQSMLDIPTEDDDGNKANTAKKTEPEATIAQLNLIKEMAEAEGVSPEDLDKGLKLITTAKQADAKIKAMKAKHAPRPKPVASPADVEM